MHDDDKQPDTYRHLWRGPKGMTTTDDKQPPELDHVESLKSAPGENRRLIEPADLPEGFDLADMPCSAR
jgi:hypothetical protein